MSAPTFQAAPWSAAVVADAVAATLDRAAEHGLPRAVADVARANGVSPVSITEWMTLARTDEAPVPPDLLSCRACGHGMILIQHPGGALLYLCAPSCARAPVPAESIRAAVAAVVLHRTPHLVPAGRTTQAALYAAGPIHRISVGATATDLRLTWRTVPRQLDGRLATMPQRLDRARRYADGGDRTRAIDVLRVGLMHINPARDKLAADLATASAAALLAALTLADRDALAALPWARWAHRSLRHLLRSHTHVEVRAALRIVAATERDTGDLTAAANAYSDLIRHHSSTEGPDALPTLAAQAALAHVLQQAGDCEAAQQLLARTITTHRRAHPWHPASTPMMQALDRMHTTCVDQDHSHPHRPAHNVGPPPCTTAEPAADRTGYCSDQRRPRRPHRHADAGTTGRRQPTEG
ncbi:tetratricopeptide repeat protein [Micromonospora sp. NPDC047707]|uniref:tetratricopeptide repeat protein n=1 Tax=Micromonospora sp. NPDC047707 TaxID=3154498 RepID=UPI0034567AE3